MRRTLLIIFLLASINFCSRNPFSEPQKSNDDFKILTTDPLNSSDGGIIRELNLILNTATYSVDCAFNRLESQTIINTLLAKAAERNIRLRVAFDEDLRQADSGARALHTSGLFSTSFDFNNENKLLFGNRGDGRVYYTFCSVDERKNFFSTSGIDRQLLESIPAFAFIMNGDQFGISRELHKEMNMLAQGLFGNGKSKLDFATKYSVLNQVVGMYWGPHENPMDVLALELNDATHSIEIYTTGFETTDTRAERDVPTVISRRLNRNIPVTMVVSSQALFAQNSKIQQFVGSSMELSQYFNNRATPSLNFIIMDPGTLDERVAFFSGSLRSRADSSDDSVLLVLKGPLAVKKTREVFNQLRAQSHAIDIYPTDITTPDNREIVINEIGWMGSMDNAGERYTTDEFVEFYNPSLTQTVNISNWRFACTTDNGSTNVNAHFVLPVGAEIPPGGYFVVSRLPDKAFEIAHFTTSKLAISDTSLECRLTDGDATAGAWNKDSSFTGTLVDRVNPGTRFNLNATRFSSTTGMSDTTARIFRSMERISSGLSGALANNWQTNQYPDTENRLVTADFRNYTFASPGGPNSNTVPDTVAPTVISISPEGTNIPAYARQVSVTFSKIMDDTVFNTSSIQLSGGTVDSFTGFSNSGRTANFLVTFSGVGTKTLTVKNTVRDLQGNYLEEDFSEEITVTTPTWARLQITEVDLKRTAFKDRIEFRVVDGGTLTGLKLQLYGSTSTLREITLPDLGIFNAGDILVYHLQVAGTSETSTDPLTSSDEGNTPGFDIFTTADNTNSLTSTKGTVEVIDPLGYSQDFMPYGDGSFGTGQEARVRDTALSGRWRINGATVAHSDLVRSDWATTSECLVRRNSGAGTAFQDQNAATDWGPGICGTGINQDSGSVVEAYSVVANSVNLNTVTLEFSRAPRRADAENTANYVFSPGVSVSSAVLNERIVTLTTALQSTGTDYTITLNNSLRRFGDYATPPPNTQYSTPLFEISDIRGGLNNTVWLSFSLPPLADSSTAGALNPDNYNITGLSILAVQQMSTNRIVLTTSQQTPGTMYPIAVDTQIVRADGTMALEDAPASFTALNLNPSFEQDTTGWEVTTSGSMLIQENSTAFHGRKYMHFNSLTTDIGGRETVSVCLPIAGGTIQTAGIHRKAPGSNVSFVNSGIRFHWFTSEDCSGTVTYSTQSQATVTPVNSWSFSQFSATAPADALSVRVGLRARRANATECSGCANTGDLLYFDQLLVNTASDSIAPIAVGTVTATAVSSSQINLSWGAASDNLTLPENLHYQICQATTSSACDTFSAIYTNVPGTTNRNITGLLPNTTYYFRIKVSDEQGNEAYYAQVSATTLGATFDLESAEADGAYFVKLTFSHAPITGAGVTGAENTANYTITGGSGLTVLGAVLSGNIVYLNTAKQANAQTYTVTVSNVMRQFDNAALTTNAALFTGTANLVRNGSFEADTNSCTSTSNTPPVSYSGTCPTGWEIYNTDTTGRSFFAIADTITQQGSNRAQFSHYTSTYGHREARSTCIPVDPAQNLALSAWFLRTSTTNTSNARLLIARFTSSDCSGADAGDSNESAAGLGDTTTLDTWLNYTRTITAANLSGYNSVRIRLQMRGAATPNLFADNITATQP